MPLEPGANPDPKVTTAEIVSSPSGKWIYVSSRGDDVIAVFSVEKNGTLQFLQNIPAAVKVPRGMAVDPAGRWLMAAGQEDGGLAMFRVDPDSGKLAPAGSRILGGSPICVCFVQNW